MPRIALFATGKEGKSRHVASQRLTNLFPEISEKPDRSILTLYRTPGLALFVDFGDSPVRGMLALGTALYIVHRAAFWEVNNAGVKTLRGTINTSAGQVAMADNGVQVLIVDGADGWIFNRTTSAFTEITDPDFPAGADVCAFADGFFLVNKGGTPQFHKSATFDGLVWDPLDFATAEYAPDNLVNIMPHQGYLGLFGEVTLEAWQNVGQVGFPYRRVSGAVIEWGLAAKRSVAKYDNSLMFLAKNRLGGAQVVLIENFLPHVVSGPDFDAEMAHYPTVSDAVAFSYFQSGHSFYHLAFPQAGATWIYDLSSDNWSQVVSGGGRHRAQLGGVFIERNLVSDFANGEVYVLSEKYLDDNGTPIECELVSKHLFDEKRQSVSSLWLDTEPATGTETTPVPHLVLTVSRDGGNTFGVGLPAPLGARGEYLTRARWSRLGRARDWAFKFRLTERAKLVITGAWLNTSG